MVKKYEIDMCTGRILPKMLAFVLPLMLSSILQLLFNAADVIVVGKFAGENSLAAVGSTSSLVNLIIGLSTLYLRIENILSYNILSNDKIPYNKWPVSYLSYNLVRYNRRIYCLLYNFAQAFSKTRYNLNMNIK